MLWYYFDQNGNKRGPYSSAQLKELALSGVVTQLTKIATSTGQTSIAGKIQGLEFLSAATLKKEQSKWTKEKEILIEAFHNERMQWQDTHAAEKQQWTDERVGYLQTIETQKFVIDDLKAQLWQLSTEPKQITEEKQQQPKLINPEYPSPNNNHDITILHDNRILSKLNKAQLAAVTTTEGYIRVVAGAGSGKTRALTHRFAYLVKELGISPSDILCVTFTNKAAGEMKKRVRRMIGDFGSGNISTFHGFCVQLLKEDCHILQYSPKFIVLDEEDSKSLIKLCFEKLGISSKQLTVQKAQEKICDFKHGCRHSHSYCGLLIDPQMTQLLTERDRASHDIDNFIEKVIYEYLYEQRKSFALDFDDLIAFALHILRNNEKARTKWQKRFQYVMVDEFQDVDADQYEMASTLSEYHKNLFIVGDPDQTIYTWRGAKIKFILDFDKNFPDVQTIVMDENYRSLPKILNASNSLIQKNKNRIEKNLVPRREGDGHSIYFHAKTQKEEAGWIAKQIEGIKDQGVGLSKIAILYRAHYVSRPIEEALINKKLTYTIYSGVAFYQRKEVKDILSYLRLIYNGDDLAFLRVVNEPKRGIGKKRIEFLREYVEKHQCSYLTALSENIHHTLFQNSQAPTFLELINKYQKVYAEYPLTDLLIAVLNESGYEEYMRTAGEEERLNNLAELKQSIYDYETTAGEETSLETYLQDIALYTNMDKTDTVESLKMMTIHSAKGLEFPFVFVCGLNEGIFPTRKTDTPEKLEEERRLAYVAFTRAEDKLFLTDSEGINFDGSFRYPSRFIFNAEKVNLDYLVELPPDLVDDAQYFISNHEDVINSVPVFDVGAKIVHPVFGRGEIQSLDEDKSSYLILFEKIATPRYIRFKILLQKSVD